jgi:pyridoxine 4-dehydrogenase
VQYGIPVIAYSPLGRGILTGQIKTVDDIPANSMLHHFPRFSPENFPINVELAKQAETIAQRKGVKATQLGINWTRAVAKETGATVIPIPGATTADKVNENSKVVDLTDEDLAELDAILSKFKPAGGRYPDFIPHYT